MFSNYLGNAILNGWLRGEAVTLPDDIYVSLHEADPGATGADEVDTADWPAYVRLSALQGGSMEDAFTEAAGPDANKVVVNCNTMLFPSYDGTGTITLTHFGLWTASTGGELLWSGAFRENPLDPVSTPLSKVLGVTDELALYPGQMGIRLG